MRFVHPWILALLWAPIIMALAGGFLPAGDPAWNPGLVSADMLARLGVRPPRRRRLGQILLFCAGLALIIVACARPQWGQRSIPVLTRNRNVMIALDVSRSMLAADVHPNRLERARVDLLDLLEALDGDRVGLIAFRHRPVLLCPLTSDYAFLRMMIDSLGTHSAPPGETDIGAALAACMDAFDTDGRDHYAVILISDGEDLSGTALAAARKAGSRGIPVFTIGIGSPAGSEIRIDNKPLSYDDKPVVSRLQHDTLAQIASESGATYVPLATLGTARTTLGDIYKRHLRKLAASERRENIEQLFVERYHWFLLPGLALLLFCAMTSPGRLVRPRRMKPASAPLAALLILFSTAPAMSREAGNPVDTVASTNPPSLTSADAYRMTREAERRWKSGDLVGAAEAYAHAASGLPPKPAAVSRWNAALAFLQTNLYEQAVNQSGPLAGDPAFSARARALAGEAQRRRALATAEDDPEKALTWIEASVASLQEALEHSPPESETSKMARSSLSLSLDALPRLRQDARIARALREAENQDAAALLENMLNEQRSLWRSAADAAEKPVPERIAAFEETAEKQERLRDLWFPIRQQILSAPNLATNRTLAASIDRVMDRADRSMATTARALRDNESAAIGLAAETEPLLFDFWTGVAPPPALINQDILLQSNALCRLPPLPVEPPAAQNAAAYLTGRFIERFPEWAEALNKSPAPPPPDGAVPAHEPPEIDEKTRAEIMRLAREAADLQQQSGTAISAGQNAGQWQHPALERLLRIRELLPRQKQKPDPNRENPPDDNRDREDPEQDAPREPPSEPEAPSQENPPEKEDAEDPLPRRIEDLMRMALEREREHAEEKEREALRIPPRTGIRDW